MYTGTASMCNMHGAMIRKPSAKTKYVVNMSFLLTLTFVLSTICTVCTRLFRRSESFLNPICATSNAYDNYTSRAPRPRRLPERWSGRQAKRKNEICWKGLVAGPRLNHCGRYRTPLVAPLGVGKLL